MKKTAPADHPIHPLLAQRWSPRAFSDRPVENEKLLSLLEAARWAPSCFNEQPWRFIIATKTEPTEHERLLACLVEANQLWARNAPVLMLSVTKINFSHNDKPNKQAQHDLGLAVENLVIQAEALGLATHQMGGFKADTARSTFSIPEGFEPIAAIAIGYPAEPDTLPEPLRERELAPRERNPIRDFVFAGSWGLPAKLIAGSSGRSGH
jgi:nitroreductase